MRDELNNKVPDDVECGVISMIQVKVKQLTIAVIGKIMMRHVISIVFD